MLAGAFAGIAVRAPRGNDALSVHGTDGIAGTHGDVSCGLDEGTSTLPFPPAERWLIDIGC